MVATRLTVQVEAYQDYPAMKMTWDHLVKAEHVLESFREITRLLEKMGPGTYVIVDLLTNPKYPLTATINGALFGPFRDPRLQAWLIVGVNNPLARMVEHTLKSVSGRSNVHWFDTEAQALAYITKHTK